VVAAPTTIPTRYDNAPKEAPEYREPGLTLGDVVADRYDSRDQDDYTQAGNLWRVLDDAQKDRTAKAIAGALSGVRQDIQMRQLCHFFRADVDYGGRIAQALSIQIDPAMLQQNQQNNPQPITA
jgi:catalase